MPIQPAPPAPPSPLPLLLAVGLLALALSGCSSAPSPTSTPSAGPDAPAASPAPAASMMAMPASGAPANGSQAFRMDGQTPAGACAFAPFVAECQLQGGQDDVRALEAPGLLLRVSGELRWNGTLPAGEPALEVYVLHDEGNGWTYSPGDPYASGPSPLAFDLPLLTLRGKVALSVTQSVGAPIGVGYAAAMLPHPFVLDGAVEYQAAGAGAGGANPS